jgi:TetR/AcrR family fatty acid metabolism transcriptional regulator
MPSTKAEHEIDSRELKRKRILRAAIEVFAEKGFFSARMTDVAKEAGVADGTLYLYFEGKEHLLISVFDDIMKQFIGRIQHEISKVDAPLEKLRAMVRIHMETLGADRPLAHVLQIETRHSRRFMNLFTRGRLGEYLNVIRLIIEEGQASGTIRDDISPGLAINFVFGSVDELVTSWLLADEPTNLAAQAEQIVGLLTDGLVPRKGLMATTPPA